MASQSKNDEKIHLSETEDLLKQDKGGEYREKLLKELVDEAFRLKKVQAKGISPEEFDKTSSMITAILAAAEAVDKTWSKHHNG